VDVHRAVARPLNEVLSWEEERVVARRLDRDVWWEAVSTGSATRGAESGAAQSDSADAADGRVQLVYQESN